MTDAFHDNALLTPQQMNEADRFTIDAGVCSFALMQAAGQAVAAVALKRRPNKVLVLCGNGNNGGDGYVAAHLLRMGGVQVGVAALDSHMSLKGDARKAYELWNGPVERAADVDPCGFCLIIDGLFGAGLERDVNGEAAAVIARANGCGVPVVAIDLPSGVDGATGQVRGIAIAATETVTFFKAKPGHYLYPGRALCGALSVVDIGVSKDSLAALKPQVCLNAPVLWHDALTANDVGHKYDKGHVAVIAGGRFGIGAARLAARAALRGGAGLVTLFVPQEAFAFHAARGPDALILRSFKDDAELLIQLEDPRISILVAGPAFGLGEAKKALFLKLVNLAKRMVIDADCITILSNYFNKINNLLKQDYYIITPHGGEFNRLFGESDSSKLLRTLEAAKRCGQTVVFKGADTVIAAPDGRGIINANASPWLATAGSGDVLSGLVAAMLAQGLEPLQAAAAAVYLHGEAGQCVGRGAIADDLIEAMPAVWQEFHKSEKPLSRL